MWYPGHIKKAKEGIKKNLKLVNAVIEIVDSRAPYSSRAYEYSNLFKGKNRIVIFNKYDICDEKKTKLWIDLYKNNGYSVFTTSLKKDNIKNLLMKKIFPVIPEKFGEKLAMVVGVPNVGKSTFINSIKGKKTLNTGNMPGITKGLQWINVNEKFRLMDTPGILFPELYNTNIVNKLILTGSLKPEGIEASDALAWGLKYINKKPEEYIQEYCIKRNFLKKGSEPDIERAKVTLLKEFSDGKIGKQTYEIPEDFDIINI